MLLELTLNNLNKNERMLAKSYSPELDDVRSILNDICNFIENKCKFLISGFGQEYWPVTVYADLPVFLEQLPNVIKQISLGNSTEIEFYEQGIERRLLLEPNGDFYKLTCISQTNWQPDPSNETINALELKNMLSEFLESFLNITYSIAPHLENNQWLKNWLNP